ncbi:flagellar hook-associated protein FlgK [Verrucomicrobiia bacterium DG1235]|nr:flagellar hook-associated protein FlgK [Verrucomicrobiae bacterium DG1235]
MSSSNIFGDLANATKALSAHRFGVTTAGNNLANVNNPDYARQRVLIGEEGMIQTIAGPQGMGVEVVGFQHMRDAVLDREVLRETSLNASLTAQQAALGKAESSLGQEINRSGDSPFIDGATADGGGSGGIAETLNNFFNAFHSLSANPGSDAEKESLLQKAEILTEKLNVTSERFSDLREALTLEVETDLDSANQMIEEIATLNAEIARAESSHAGQALSLRDQRQAVLRDLSEIMQIKTENIDDSAGQIRVYIPTIGGDSPQLDLVSRGRFQTVDLDDSGVNPVFTVGEDAIQIDVRGGSVHGALKSRDGAIAEYQRGLDDLAKELVTQVNGLYNSGVSPNDTNFFSDTSDPSEFTAAGITLASDLTASTLRTSNASTDLGDNSLTLAIAELDDTNQAALGNRNFGTFYRSIVTDLGENVAAVDSRLEDENIVFELLKQQQDAVSGVSIDEEMTDMMKFQRAFQATGKLIQTIDEMLDVIVNRLI